MGFGSREISLEFGSILPDQITILFTDIPFDWKIDQQAVQEYITRLQTAVRRALPDEEAILICVFPVSHSGYIAAVRSPRETLYATTRRMTK